MGRWSRWSGAVALAAFAVFGSNAAQAGGDQDVLPVDDLIVAQPGAKQAPVHGRLLMGDEMGMTRVITGELLLEFGEEDGDRWRSESDPDRDRARRPALLGDADLVWAVSILTGIDRTAMSADAKRGTLRVSSAGAGVAKAAIGRIRALRPPVVTVVYSLERIDAAGTARVVLSGTEPVLAGSTSVFADTTRRAVLADYDVEIADASKVADPITGVLRTGASVMLRVRCLPGHRSAVVEALARSAAPASGGPIESGFAGIGNMDRCSVEINEAGVAFRVGSGETAVHEWSDRSGDTMRLTISPSWQAAERRDDDAVLFWSPLLGDVEVTGFANQRLNSWDVNAEESEERPSTSRKLAQELLARGDVPGTGTEGPHLSAAGITEIVPTSASSAAEVYRRLTAAVERILDVHDVELRVAVVRTGADVPLSGELPAGGTELLRVSGPALADLPILFNSSHEQRYLADWDVEVAKGSTIPDPLLSAVEEGHFVDVRVNESPDGSVASVLLDLELVRLDKIERQVTRLSVGEASGRLTADTTHGKNTNPSTQILAVPPSPPIEVAVEKPVARRLRIARELPLNADGTVTVRRSATGFAGDGLEVVVVIRVN